MKITNLSIEAFLAVGRAELSLDGLGLVSVQGRNEDDTSADSNGAGKSSIADAVCWCLYGVTARGEDGDGVVNRKLAKNCRVAVEIDDDGKRWIIARHRKHKAGKNALQVLELTPGGEQVDRTAGTGALTQTLVDRLVGCTADVFRASVYCAQEQFPDLPGATDKRLKGLVEEAAGVTVLEAALEEAKGRATAARRLAEERNRTLEVVQSRHGMADEAHALAVADRDAFDALRRERVGEAHEALVAAKNAAVQAARAVGALGRSDYEATIAACDAVDSSAEADRDKLRDLSHRASQDASSLAVHEAAAARCLSDLRSAKVRVDEVEARVGQPCGECGKPITASDLATVKAGRVAALRDAAQRHAETKALATTAAEASSQSDAACKAHLAGMPDLADNARRRGTATAALRDIDRATLERDRLVGVARTAAETYEARRTEPNPHGPAVERTATAVTEAATKAKAAQDAADEANAALARAETVVKVFGPAGVRARVLDQVTPYLNARTAEYLGALSDGNLSATWSTLNRTKAGELREKFAIEVGSRTGGETFKAASGGEKRKVRLAAALALQDLVASRATKPVEFRIMDEVDDALDSAGLERLMGILEEKAASAGTLLVISHRDLKSHIPNTITVTKSAGLATIRRDT